MTMRNNILFPLLLLLSGGGGWQRHSPSNVAQAQPQHQYQHPHQQQYNPHQQHQQYNPQQQFQQFHPHQQQFQQYQQQQQAPPKPPLKAGALNRFWKHHIDEESLMVDGINQYPNIQTCLQEALGMDVWNNLDDYKSKTRSTGQTLTEPDGTAYMVVIQNAMSPVHVQAVQALAKCVQTHIPSLYESRAMYQEMELDDDEQNMGGNCPTHLAPLVSIFLPAVRREMNAVLKMAFEVGEWQYFVDLDQELGFPRKQALPHPSDTGIRASEHLTYRDFPLLSAHTDGDTAYTMNFAFAGPDDYQGGDFFIIDLASGDKHMLKPNKYECMVFWGGRYMHGVSEITGGHREMFSTELWHYPDLPFGSNLWTATPPNMETYIRRCNDLNGINQKCTAEFPNKTWSGKTLKDSRNQYDPKTGKKKKEYMDSPKYIDRPNRIQPQPLVPSQYQDAQTGKTYNVQDDFRSIDDEPDFLIPKTLEPGEMVPIRWRDNATPIDGDEGESFVIGFPPELHQEFAKYVENTGMKKIAKQLLYEETPLQPEEHRIYTLDDGNKWGAMVQGNWETDMIWLDPANEDSFESLMGVLFRGRFDIVLDQVGKAFDLDSLMVQGVGAIFLSEYAVSDNMHVDIVGSKGSFYNIIVPVHIPVNMTAQFYAGNHQDKGRVGKIAMDPNVGIVMGGESSHGTGECNYRNTQDFRLSFAVYVADINEDNIDLIASDSTSLWPTSGDTEWFRSQKGRVWSKDGSTSLRTDQGRQPMNVQDRHADCSEEICETDVTYMRLLCPKTCKLYLEDDVYYAKYFTDEDGKAGGPNSTPTCALGETPDGSTATLDC